MTIVTDESEHKRLIGFPFRISGPSAARWPEVVVHFSLGLLQVHLLYIPRRLDAQNCRVQITIPMLVAQRYTSLRR